MARMARTAQDDAARRCCRVELSASPLRTHVRRISASSLTVSAGTDTVPYNIHTTFAKVIHSW